MIIILIGYMGSGKSTIGKKLSQTLNFEFIDLDDYIQEMEQLTISEIFKNKGEIYFRKQEHFYLKEVLKRNNVILSLGGGTPCYGDNMQAILTTEGAHSIYLKSTILNLVQRLVTEKSQRPLIAHLKTDEALTEFVGKHLFERSFYYSQSNQILLTDGKTIEGITEEIVAGLF
ncbi:shikimate kinase [Gelidibacter salicanalis]|uniref:Shikimate kinase n=1 Tax=Gelidibacter salicanalis TaxID=291193 RepID=A0A934NKY7_9FLAO|nr:shikimate kinase [Gelidibacter salicanalis]MBJ7883052.1 AAA family ATPase [Gelidibacter salicanalis]